MQIILYLITFIFICFTSYIIISAAVSAGVRNGLGLFYADVIGFLGASASAQATKTQSADEASAAVQEILDAEQSGELSSENATKLLRNLRGETK